MCQVLLAHHERPYSFGGLDRKWVGNQVGRAEGGEGEGTVVDM